jgi:hypothetical protein
MHSFQLALLLTMFAGVFTAAAAEASAPNILYIFTDDQSYRTVSCYPRAYNFANTPNIDQLAKRGVRFDQAYMGAKCVPSRATALTGRLQFAARIELRRNRYRRQHVLVSDDPGQRLLHGHDREMALWQGSGSSPARHLLGLVCGLGPPNTRQPAATTTTSMS